MKYKLTIKKTIYDIAVVYGIFFLISTNAKNLKLPDWLYISGDSSIHGVIGAVVLTGFAFAVYMESLEQAEVRPRISYFLKIASVGAIVASAVSAILAVLSYQFG